MKKILHNNKTFFLDIKEEENEIVFYFFNSKKENIGKSSVLEEIEDVFFEEIEYLREYNDTFQVNIEDLLEDKEFFYNISFFEIEEQYRKNGFGTLFLNYILKYLSKKEGNNSIYLNASPTGTNKIRLDLLEKFYKKFGFQIFLEQSNNTMMFIADIKDIIFLKNKQKKKTTINQKI